jgi:putative membrane protein
MNGARNDNTNNQLANNRTFLAWVRTSIGIMAFGFVIERFNLFIKQISLVLLQIDPTQALFKSFHLNGNTSSYLGAILVLTGAVICLLAFVQFLQDQKKIGSENYQPSNWLYAILTGVILLVGLFLAFYLNQNFSI